MDIEQYIFKYSGPEHAVLVHLDRTISSYPGVVSKIRFKIPFYYMKSWLCYLNVVKTGGVELAFTRGNELVDDGNILEARGRKQVMGVIYRKLDDIDDVALNEILQEAFLLDDQVPYASKRTIKK